MNYTKTFNEFLRDSVNLNQARLDQLEDRVEIIVDYLTRDDNFGGLYDEHIPQGSWAHQTIIRPVGDYDEFDADFLLKLVPKGAWLVNPRECLHELRAAFKRSSTYKTMVRKKNRCVRIGYANDCHIDVVPLFVFNGGRQVIVNYAENAFEETNPEAFTAWMKEKDEQAGGHLRRVLRLLKYLRDFKNTFSCPSVILTTIVGSRVRLGADYGDLPTALLTLISDLDAWLSQHSVMPRIEDPSCPGTTFHHRWDEAQYANFRNKISIYADSIRDAYDELDEEKSLRAWQKIFGPDFKPSEATKSLLTATEASLPAEPRAPDEEFIEERGFRRVGGFQAQIDCNVEPKPGFRSGSLRAIGRVQKDRWLTFRLTTTAPYPFNVFWKVRNHGQEAAQAGDLRGELLADGGRQSRREHTMYTGQHYVEAYVVRDGLLLAQARQDVIIT